MKINKLLASMILLGTAAILASCGSASDSDSEQTNKDLRGMPASVGKNELAGRELLYQASESEKCIIKFSDTTVTIDCIIESKPTDNYTRTCEYTCDSKKHRFAMRKKSFDEPKYPLKDYTSYETIKETVFTSEVPESYIKEFFLTHDDYGVFEYKIDEENETISLIPRKEDTFSSITYVDGYLGCEGFKTRLTNTELDENCTITIDGSRIMLANYKTDYLTYYDCFDTDYYTLYYPASEVLFDLSSEYNFSSTLWNGIETIGKIEGKFYKAEFEDYSEKKFFLEFTSIPNEFSYLKNEPILISWDCFERFHNKYYHPIVFTLKK